MRVHLKPELGGVRLSRLNAPLVAHTVSDVATVHRFMAVEVRRVLRIACSQAERLGVLTSNPVDGGARPGTTPGRSPP